jgi:hypothetical protein
LSVSIARHCAILVEFDPFGWAVQACADRDLEIVDVPVIEAVSRWGCLKCLLIVVDFVLKLLDLLSELEVECGSVCLSPGNGGQ